MTPETSKALEESIAHWERVVDNPLDEKIGINACSLCALFGDCEFCPVKLSTGLGGCRDTPYTAFRSALYRAEDQDEFDRYPISKATMENLKQLAEKELQFLISLREG